MKASFSTIRNVVCKMKSQTSNGRNRDKIAQFLINYFICEYIAKSIILLNEGKNNVMSNMQDCEINVEDLERLIKSKYSKNINDIIHYVFNPKEYKKRTSCKKLRNKIVHSLDEASIQTISKDGSYIEYLNKFIKEFEKIVE